MATFRRVYAQNHPYFITITTEKRRPLLIENITILRQAFAYSKQYFEYEIDSICIMPDHLHMIIQPKNETEYPNIIKSIKTYFSKNIKQTFKTTQSQTKKGELGIWQRRFYEHTIRDDNELEKYRNYIHYNPVKHGLVLKTSAWKYSSFGKFVRNGFYDEEWYSLDEDLDLEYQS